MTDRAAAPVPAGAPPAERPDPAHTPGTSDYVRGILAVVGVLIVIIVVGWLALVVLGVDLCGCTTQPPASPSP